MDKKTLRKEFAGFKLQKATVEEAEAKSLAEVAECAPRVPQVTFGFAHDEWEVFKAKMEPGDELIFFDSFDIDWFTLCGSKGYAIVRLDVSSNKFWVVARYVTCMS